MVSEYDKKQYDFSLEFTLHEVFIWAQLLAMSENDAEFLTNLSPWTPAEHAKQYLILILLLTRNSKIFWDRFIDRCWDEIEKGRNKSLLRAI